MGGRFLLLGLLTFFTFDIVQFGFIVNNDKHTEQVHHSKKNRHQHNPGIGEPINSAMINPPAPMMGGMNIPDMGGKDSFRSGANLSVNTPRIKRRWSL